MTKEEDNYKNYETTEGFYKKLKILTEKRNNKTATKDELNLLSFLESILTGQPD